MKQRGMYPFTNLTKFHIYPYLKFNEVVDGCGFELKNVFDGTFFFFFKEVTCGKVPTFTLFLLFGSFGVVLVPNYG